MLNQNRFARAVLWTVQSPNSLGILEIDANLRSLHQLLWTLVGVAGANSPHPGSLDEHHAQPSTSTDAGCSNWDRSAVALFNEECVRTSSIRSIRTGFPRQST